MKINRLIYEDLLKEQGIKLDSNDIISEDLNSKLKEGMTIEVVDVVVETIKESKSIDYGVEFVEDANLVKGTTKVYNEGISGVNDIVYTLTYHNGELIEKKFIEELVKVEPQNKVVQKGTFIAEDTGSAIRGNKIDIFMPDASKVSNWGRKNIEIYIVR